MIATLWALFAWITFHDCCLWIICNHDEIVNITNCYNSATLYVKLVPPINKPPKTVHSFFWGVMVARGNWICRVCWSIWVKSNASVRLSSVIIESEIALSIKQISALSLFYLVPIFVREDNNFEIFSSFHNEVIFNTKSNWNEKLIQCMLDLSKNLVFFFFKFD